MNYKVKKFLVSFAWNFGMMAVAFALDFTAKNLGIFNLPEEAIVVLGLILARISKVVNVYFQEKATEQELY